MPVIGDLLNHFVFTSCLLAAWPRHRVRGHLCQIRGARLWSTASGLRQLTYMPIARCLRPWHWSMFPSKRPVCS